MHLHSNGQQDHIKELKRQREAKIQEVEETTMLPEQKKTLIHKIITRFNQLIKDTDESLYIESNKELTK